MNWQTYELWESRKKIVYNIRGKTSVELIITLIVYFACFIF